MEYQAGGHKKVDKLCRVSFSHYKIEKRTCHQHKGIHILVPLVVRVCCSRIRLSRLDSKIIKERPLDHGENCTNITDLFCRIEIEITKSVELCLGIRICELNSGLY